MNPFAKLIMEPGCVTIRNFISMKYYRRYVSNYRAFYVINYKVKIFFEVQMTAQYSTETVLFTSKYLNTFLVQNRFTSLNRQVSMQNIFPLQKRAGTHGHTSAKTFRFVSFTCSCRQIKSDRTRSRRPQTTHCHSTLSTGAQLLRHSQCPHGNHQNGFATQNPP